MIHSFQHKPTMQTSSSSLIIQPYFLHWKDQCKFQQYVKPGPHWTNVRQTGLLRGSGTNILKSLDKHCLSNKKITFWQTFSVFAAKWTISIHWWGNQWKNISYVFHFPWSPKSSWLFRFFSLMFFRNVFLLFHFSFKK